jgi:hypothetical protein
MLIKADTLQTIIKLIPLCNHTKTSLSFVGKFLISFKGNGYKALVLKIRWKND